jgi:hypothetical protein
MFPVWVGVAHVSVGVIVPEPDCRFPVSYVEERCTMEGSVNRVNIPIPTFLRVVGTPSVEDAFIIPLTLSPPVGSGTQFKHSVRNPSGTSEDS